MPSIAGELSTPVATTKVDPAYPSSLQHDGVQGTVVLYAVIHADGTVGDIRVLHGLNEVLDVNAVKALSRWKFRPAMKSGAPVDLEAVVQIPFVAGRNIF
jgi:TonB family protein